MTPDDPYARRRSIRLTPSDREAVEKVRARYEQPRPFQRCPVRSVAMDGRNCRCSGQVGHGWGHVFIADQGDVVVAKTPGVNWATVFALVFAGGLAGWWLGAVIEGLAGWLR